MKPRHATPIEWAKWWPFTRATGNALKQLNRNPATKTDLSQYEDAPL